jgi:hypothetical protein
MEAVARELNHYHKQFGRLPEEGNEREFCEKKLSVAAGKNAYAPILNEGEAADTAINIQTDMNLSAVRIPDFESKKLKWSKPVKPGTITVIHNTENFYLVWGAGIDGMPILSENQRKIFLIAHDFAQD